MRISCLCALVLAAAHPLSASAALHLVPDDFPTVQAAIDAAVTGDFVHIRAGTYVQALSLSGKDLVIFGDGSGTTILTTSDAGRILDIGAGVTAATVISDLALVDGRAEDGGGVGVHSGASPLLRRCRLESNTAYSASESHGGAVFVRAAALTIEACAFVSNGAFIDFVTGSFGVGGAIYADDGATLDVRSTSFHQQIAGGFEGGLGGAVYVAGATASFTDCSFENCFAMTGAAILGNDADLTVTRCTFEGNSSAYGYAAIDWSATGAAWDLRVTSSVFHDNWSLGGGVIRAWGTALLSRNTLAFNEASGGSVLLLFVNATADRNIVAFNDATGVDGISPMFSCNDVEGNTTNYSVGFGDRTGISNNISADPLFCDSPARDLRLQASSPCASLSGCGRIGALPVNCAPTSVDGPRTEGIVQLAPVRPNPGPAPVVFSVEVSRTSHVRLEVFDVGGRLRARLADQALEAGRHEFRWSGAEGARSGIFFAVLRTDDRRVARRFVLVE